MVFPLEHALFMTSSRLVVFLFLFSILTTDAEPLPPGTPLFIQPVTNSPSGLVEMTNGKFLVWTSVSGAAWATMLNADGSADPSFQPGSGPDYNVTDVALSPGGTMLVAGNFTRFSGLPFRSLVRMQSDGTVIPNFNPDLDGPVDRVFALPDGRIFILGRFSRVGTVHQSGMASLNPDGSFDTFFKPVSVDGNYPNYFAPLRDGRIYIGTGFVKVNGLDRYGIALLNSAGDVLDSFVPDKVTRSGSGAATISYPTLDWLLPVSDGRLIIAGTFDHVGDLPRTNLARLNPTGTVDSTFEASFANAAPPKSISYVAQEKSGRIIVGGLFNQISGQARFALVRLLSNGTLDTSFVTALPSYCSISLVRLLSDDTVLVSGRAAPPGASPYSYVARLAGGDALPSPPRIIEDLKSQNVSLGDNVALSIAAASVTSMRYQWYHNGEELPFQTNATLELRNFHLADVGAYSARVQNDLGTADTSIALVSVLNAPKVPGGVDPTFASGEGANGEIRALVALNDGQLLAGGAFSRYNGIERTGLVRLNADGTVDGKFLGSVGSNGIVRTLAVQPDQKIWIGGRFAQFNGRSISNLVRLNPDGSLDETAQLGLGPSRDVYSIAIQPDGKVLVGGTFTSFAGLPYARLVRLEADGTVDPSFVNSSPNGTVNAIAVQKDGRILIAGCFGVLDDVTRIEVARLLPNGHVDTEFNPGFGVGNQHTSNQCVKWLLALPDGKVLLGGFLDWANDQGAGSIVRLTEDGNVDPTFFTTTGDFYSPDPTSCAVLQPDGRVLVGGAFFFVNRRSQQRLVRLNTDGSVDSNFKTTLESLNGPIPQILAMLPLPNGNLLAADSSANPDGSPRYRVLRYHGGDSSPSGPTISSIVDIGLFASNSTSGIKFFMRAAVGQDVMLAAPSFSFEPLQYQWQTNGINVPNATNPILRIPNISIGASQPITLLVRNSVGAAKSPTATFTVNSVAPKIGGPDPSFAPEGPINGKVFGMALQPDGKIVIAGSFIRVGDVSRWLVARLNSDGSLDPFGPDWRRAEGHVNALALQSDGKVLLGGGFVATRPDGIDSYLVRLETNGAIDTSFRPVFNDGAQIYALAVGPDQRIAVGGNFRSQQGITQQNILILREDGTVDPRFNAWSDGSVHALIWQPDGKLVVGGSFSAVDGVRSPRLARLNADGTLDPSFELGEGLDDTVLALALANNGDLMVGGDFLFAGGEFTPGLARVHSDGTVDSTFVPSVDNGVIRGVLVQPDNKVIITGSFTRLESRRVAAIARLELDGRVDQSFNGSLEFALGSDTGNPATGWVLGLQPDGNILVGGFFNAVGGMHRARVARLFGSIPPSEPPKVLEPPRDVTARYGATVTLGVRHESLWPVKYQWSVVGTNSGTLFGNASQLFRFTGVNFNNSNDYLFTAEVNGIATNAQLRLTVNPESSRAGMPELTSFYGAGANAVVRALLRQGDGLIWIGGDFTSYNGRPRLGIARLQTNGDLDDTVDLSPFLKGRVFTLADDGKGGILIGGQLFLQDGSSQPLVRLNFSRSLDPTFHFDSEFTGVAFCILAYSHDVLWAGGDFRSAKTGERLFLVCLNADGSIHPAWDRSQNPDGPVFALAKDAAGGVWVGGEFTHFAGQTRPGFARIRPSGELDLDEKASSGIAASRVHAIAVRPNGEILLAGTFRDTDQQLTRSVTVIAPNGERKTSDSLFGVEGGEAEPCAIVPTGDDDIVLAGEFSAVRLDRRTTRHGMAKVLHGAELDLAFDPESGAEGLGPEPSIRAMVVEPDGNLLVAGGFSFLGGVVRGGVGRIVGTNPPVAFPLRLPTQFPVAGPDIIQELRSSPLRTYVYPANTPPDQFEIVIEPGAPEGITVDPVTATVHWIPTEAQGPSTNMVVYRIRDLRVPDYQMRVQLPVIVQEINSAPVLAAVPRQTATVGERLVIALSAHDEDIPANTIRYLLARAAPTGMHLAPESGVLTWTPSSDQVGLHRLEVIASDDGSPPAYGLVAIEIAVSPRAVAPQWAAAFIDNGMLTLRLDSEASGTYNLESSFDLRNWEQVKTVNPTVDGRDVTFVLPETGVTYRFYRLRQP